MKIIVGKHELKIEKEIINEKEINITKCEFEFDEEITNDFVKDVYFTLNDETYKISNIQNNECDIPNEVLNKKGMVELGVVAYLIENEEYVKRYNPTSTFFPSERGSLKEEYENSEELTPSDKEQMEQAIQEMETKVDNLDIEASKSGGTTTITITRKDGTQETTEINDGVDGEDGADFQYNWSGTSLGIKTSEEQNYQYVNLKGERGEPGAIKMIIVNELPQTGDEDTIYLVPLAIPESQENRYAEYVYINNNWELLGKIGIQVDLSDYYTKTETNNLLENKANVSDIPDLTNYVQNTDYATGSTAGVFKSANSLAVNGTGQVQAQTLDFEAYSSRANTIFIGKGTLENVIAGKQLVNQTYVDNIVGDINTALDTINGEVI